MIVSRAEYAARSGRKQDESGIIESALEFGRGFGELHRPPLVAVFADPPPRTARPNE